MVPTTTTNQMNPLFIDETAKFALSSQSFDGKPDLVPASDESSASEASGYSLKTIPPASSPSSAGEHELAHALVKSLSFDCVAEESKERIVYRRIQSLNDGDWRSNALPKQLSNDTLILEQGPVTPRDKDETTSSASSTACESLDSSKREKRVSWGNLEIRKYPTIPGVHPDCMAGPPVRLPLFSFVYRLCHAIDRVVSRQLLI
jgi:hypothetical protein